MFPDINKDLICFYILIFFHRFFVNNIMSARKDKKDMWKYLSIDFKAVKNFLGDGHFYNGCCSNFFYSIIDSVLFIYFFHVKLSYARVNLFFFFNDCSFIFIAAMDASLQRFAYRKRFFSFGLIWCSVF